MMKLYYIFIFLTLLWLTGCESIAIHSTPQKKPIASHSILARNAEYQFWQALHQGSYENIPEIDRLLTAAYLENPNDPLLASHLGFLHTWKITERNRNSNVPPTIVNEIILANKYFNEAYILNPHDPRILGFLGDTQLISGQIFKDDREQTRGYFTLKNAIHAWPEFNYFTAGYPMSTKPATSEYFKEGLTWQWATLDRCTGKKIDRKNPSFKNYMNLETKIGFARACWNSWIAPYNFEGFFLNMGDMLVKAGDVDTAIKIYQNAKLDKSYNSWPYKNMLEKRIINAKANVKNFEKPYSSPEKTILFDSGFGCMVCHQAK